MIVQKEKTANDLLNMAYALIGTIEEMGNEGAPSGPMYQACMEKGYTLDQYEAVMALLVRKKIIRKSNHCYFTIPKP